MPETFEYMRERLGWLADRILEFITGSSGYRLEKVRAEVPDIQRFIGARLSQRLPRSVSRCDRY